MVSHMQRAIEFVSKWLIVLRLYAIKIHYTIVFILGISTTAGNGYHNYTYLSKFLAQ